MGQLFEIGQIVEYVDLIEPRSIGFPVSATAKWFCAVTNPNCQPRASLGLHELGYRSFYPKVRRWVSHARVKMAKEKPLLGRYIFVEVDLKDDRQSFYAVRGVNGVEGLVSNPDPIAIPTEYVTRLRERYMDGEWDFVTQDKVHCEDAEGCADIRVNEPLPIGARIKLMEGEFADMLATVIGKQGRRGKTILFKVFGENRYGQLHLDNVRAA